MKNLGTTAILIAVAAIAVLIYSAAYTVREDQQSLVLRFGDPVKSENAYGVEEDAGLKFKIPFIETVRDYDRKNLELDLQPQLILASDQERLNVDAFLRYRITDVQKFYERFNRRGIAEDQMKGILDSLLRDTLASVPSQEIISGQRAKLMKQILDRANIRASDGNFGVTFIDVRIMRADLPETVEQQVFQRMIADRNEETNRNLGDGSRQAQQIRAEAQKTKDITIANAQKQSELIKAEGDSEQNRIYAEAYSVDADFFEFYRSMEALRNGFGTKTNYVMSPDSDLLSYLQNDRGQSSSRGSR
ncbi:MAG: protease modulator HflC [Litorimonas sp.]